MKISNSKKELARIIRENGGWRDGAQFSAQDKDGEVFHYAAKPTIGEGREVWSHKGCIGEGEFTAEKLPNWHQSCLSREEYFHLYPAPESKPTIEQLAADYHNAKEYAERKQKEADAAKADADEKLRVLEIAGEALGLLVSTITAKQEPELVITGLRDLRVGDEVKASYGDIEHVTGKVIKLDIGYKNQPVYVSDGIKSLLATDWKFISRP